MVNGVGRGLDRQTPRGSEAPRKPGDALGEVIQPWEETCRKLRTFLQGETVGHR